MRKTIMLGKRTTTLLIIVFALLLVCSIALLGYTTSIVSQPSVKADDYPPDIGSTGIGTLADPYKIYAPEHLGQMRDRVNSVTSNYKTAYYRLENDIDMYAWLAINSPAVGWVPIGDYNYNRSFSGHFDGQNYSIKGLWANRQGLVNGLIASAGGLFGLVDEGSISNLGLVLNRSTNAAQNGINYGQFAGGIIGFLGAAGGYSTNGVVSITNCFVSGNVTADAAEAGLLVGIARTSSPGYASIERCVVTGSVNSISTPINSAAVCGSAMGPISFSDCAAVGVTVPYTGGIVNGYTIATTITNSYFSGGTTSAVRPFFPVSRSTSVTASGVVHDSTAAPYASTVQSDAATYYQMRDIDTFTSLNWDFSNIWEMDPNKNDGAPSIISNPGKGVLYNEFGIHSVNDLVEYRSLINSGTFGALGYERALLKNDLDLTDYLSPTGAGYNAGEGWVPIGNSSSGAKIEFYGEWHTISGLWINRPGSAMYENAQGLFGFISGGSIQKLGVETGPLGVTGGMYVGVMAGVVKCSDYDFTIEDCYTYGKVKGSQQVGGFIGRASSDAGTAVGSFDINIIRCSSTTEVRNITNSNANIGGFIGYIADVNTGGRHSYNIDDCYTRSNIIITGVGVANVGGFVGYLGSYSSYSKTISRTYSATTIDGAPSGASTGGYIGNLFLSSASVNIYDSFIDTDLMTGGLFGLGSTSGVSGEDTYHLFMESTFSSLYWDFGAIWYMSEGNTYPYLQPWPAKIEIAAPSVTNTYTYGDSFRNSDLTNGWMWVSGQTPVFAQSTYTVYKDATDDAFFDYANPLNGAELALLGYVYSAAEHKIYLTITVSVEKAVLTVTAENKEKVYGQLVPGMTYKVEGFKYSDNKDTINLTVGMSTPVTPSSNVGTYVISVVGTGHTSSNYTITTVNGIMTVTALKVAKPTIDSDLTYSGLMQEAPLVGYISVAMTLTGDAGGKVNAGNFVLEVTPTANYVWEGDDTKTTIYLPWTIKKAPLTIKANDKEAAYNQAFPTFNYSVSGYLNGEGPSVITGSFGLTTTASVGDAPGTYDIVLTNINASSVNYNYILVDGTLTIKARTLDPDTDAALIGTIPGPYTVSYVKGGLTLSSIAIGAFAADGTLPGAWSWSSPTMGLLVGQNQQHYATFTPIDTSYAPLDIYITVNVNKGQLAFPTVTNLSFEYNGSSQGPTIDAYDTTLIGIAGFSSGSSINSYTITFSVINKSFFEWEGGGTVDYLVEWNITIGKLVRPVFSNLTLTYVAHEQAPSISTYDTSRVGLGGTTLATSVGSYSITAFIMDKANYEWADGGNSDITASWSIIAATLDPDSDALLIGTIPGPYTVVYTSGITLNAIVIISFIADGDLMGLWNWKASTTALFAGTNQQFTATFYPVTDNYNPIDISITVNVTKAQVAKPTITNLSFTYNGSAQGPSIGSYNTSIINITETKSATTVGPYSFTVALIDKANYEWSPGVDANYVVDWSISKAQVAKPTITDLSLTYTGSAQGPNISSYDASIISITGTTSATTVGSYSLTVSLLDKVNYEWGVGDDANYGVNWNISLSALVPGVDFDDNIGPFTITYVYGVTLNSILLPSGAGNLVPGTWSWKVSSTLIYFTTGATYVAVYTPTDTVNYSAVDVNVTVIVNKAQVAKPTVTGLTFTYNGSAQGPNISSYDTAIIDITGTVVATDAGSYNFTVFLRDTTNYEWIAEGSLSYGVSWNIAKATLTVIADDKSITFDQDIPLLTISFSGFVPGENATTSIIGAFGISTTATKGDPANTYSITVSQGSATSTNYSFVFTHGILTISGKAVGDGTVSMDNWIYGRTPSDPVSTSSTYDINDVTYKYIGVGTTDYQTSSVRPVNAGTYQIIATFSENSLYAGFTAIGSFTIEKETIIPPSLIDPPTVDGPHKKGNTLDKWVLSPGGWTWSNPKAKPSRGESVYEAIIIVDDVNYDFTGVVGYDAATHTVKASVTVTAEARVSPQNLFFIILICLVSFLLLLLLFAIILAKKKSDKDKENMKEYLDGGKKE